MSVIIEKRITGYAVHQPGVATPPPQQHPKPAVSNDADRRLVLSSPVAPLANSLRWASRPYDPDGHPSRTYMVHAPEGKFAVTVVHSDAASASTKGYPFEVWVSDGAPRGLKALCKSLSMDMRSLDRGWLLAKLDSLAKTRGTPFDITLPGGLLVNAPSSVSAFAQIVRARCGALGAFDDEELKSTPFLDALLSKKEPKAFGEGTVGQMFPISQTGYREDDFEMALKEVKLEDGRILPLSVWFAGSYPSSLDGLAKSLSFDLRVNDVQWSVLKLQQLLDMDEPNGSFWAGIPGQDKSTSYPSLVSYLATLILYRLKVLGLVDQDLQPTAFTGVVAVDAARKSFPQSPPVTETGIKGEKCWSCGAYAVVRTGGCESCTSCSESRCG